MFGLSIYVEQAKFDPLQKFRLYTVVRFKSPTFIPITQVTGIIAHGNSGTEEDQETGEEYLYQLSNPPRHSILSHLN